MKRLAAVALLLAGCAAGHPEPADLSSLQPVKAIVFRLDEKPDAVEVRLEGDYFAAHNYELAAHARGEAGSPDGVDVRVWGVRVPPESHGSAAPASGLLVLPHAEAPSASWKLVFVYQPRRGEKPTVDTYTVEHVAGGWKVSPLAGEVTRYEAQGSY